MSQKKADANTDATREEYARLEDRIAAWMRLPAAEATEAEFNALALDVFAFQARHNSAYANFCRAGCGSELSRPSSWRDIPTVPTDAFRLAQAPLSCFPPGDAALRFETSGTTSETRGTHYLPSAALYRASVLLGWRELALPELPVIALAPSPDQAPHSSLSFMMETLAAAFGAATDESPFLMGSGETIETAALTDAVERGEPFLLLGTAIAFLHLFEVLESENRTLALPAGSRAMETGGYKGTRRELSKADLYTRFETFLGLAPNAVINEYGMTELGSQFYATGLGGSHRGPHWTRARVLDPETGNEVDPDESGYLVITDLANLGSCAAIATRDLALRREQGFELLGRDPSALPRGCSRAADEILSRNP